MLLYINFLCYQFSDFANTSTKNRLHGYIFCALYFAWLAHGLKPFVVRSRHTEWWEGLEDPRRRQERKRRRRREAEEDEVDREREQEEQVTQQVSQQPQPEGASDAESDRDRSPNGGSFRKRDQKERDRPKDKDKARDRALEKVPREEHKCAVDSSQKKVKVR